MLKEKAYIIHIGAEVVPFSKVGGLADIIGILPNQLEKKLKNIQNISADKLITVSPNYASELINKKTAHPGLELFEKFNKDVIGIINGIDKEKWSPQNNKVVYFHIIISVYQKSMRIRKS